MTAYDSNPSPISTDPNSFDYWRGHVDTLLFTINQKMDNVVQQLSSMNDWKTSIEGNIRVVNEKLDAHSRMIESQATAIRDTAEALSQVSGAVEEVSRNLGNHITAESVHMKDEEKSITFEYVVSRLGVPILVALATYFFTVLLPQFIEHLKLP